LVKYGRIALPITVALYLLWKEMRSKKLTLDTFMDEPTTLTGWSRLGRTLKPLDDWLDQ